jgi:hypothetical protein
MNTDTIRIRVDEVVAGDYVVGLDAVVVKSDPYVPDVSWHLDLGGDVAELFLEPWRAITVRRARVETRWQRTIVQTTTSLEVAEAWRRQPATSNVGADMLIERGPVTELPS